MTPTLTRGWAPLRGVLVGREKLIDLPIAELYDLRGGSGRAAQPLCDADRSGAGARERAEDLQHRAARPARRRKRPRRSSGCGRSATSEAASAAVREEYTDADDPKRLIELEQTMTRAADAFRQGQLGEAIEMYKSVIAKRADTEDAYRKLALVYWRSGRPR